MIKVVLKIASDSSYQFLPFYFKLATRIQVLTYLISQYPFWQSHCIIPYDDFFSLSDKTFLNDHLFSSLSYHLTFSISHLHLNYFH